MKQINYVNLQGETKQTITKEDQLKLRTNLFINENNKQLKQLTETQKLMLSSAEEVAKIVGEYMFSFEKDSKALTKNLIKIAFQFLKSYSKNKRTENHSSVTFNTFSKVF